MSHSNTVQLIASTVGDMSDELHGNGSFSHLSLEFKYHGIISAGAMLLSESCMKGN